MKTVVFALVIAGFLVGCGSKSPEGSQAWLILSWEAPVLTVEHGGNKYKATCIDSITMHPDGKDPDSTSHCFLPINQVGHAVQPFNGRTRDPDGRIVEMLVAGRSLALRSYDGKDTNAPWFQADYTITSVIKNRQ